MDPGSELTVRVTALSEGGASTLLGEVAGTGSGIPDDLLGTIDPFVTTNNVGRSGCTFTIEFPVPAVRPVHITP